MEIPAPQAGTVTELRVAVGDTVSEGDRRDRRGVDGAATADGARAPSRAREPTPSRSADGAGAQPTAPPAPPRRREAAERGDEHAGVLVLGSGPGGYAAAFRAADLGLDVVLVERHERARRRLPQRRLHPVQGAAARRQGDRRGRGRSAEHGVAFGEPKIDLDALRAWKDGVVGKLTGGLDGHGEAAQGRASCTARRASPARTCSRSTADGTRSSPSTRDHRRRLARGRAARHPARRPARHGLDRRARARATSPSGCSSSAAASSASRWRRSTTRSARRSPSSSSPDQLIPGCDPDLVRAAAQAHRRALRGDPPRRRASTAVEAQRRRAARRRFAGDVGAGGLRPRARRGRPHARTARRSALDARRRRGRRARLHRASTSSCARTSPHIYAIGDVVGRADARPQGHARGPRRGRGDRRPRRRLRRARDARRSPTPSPRSRGSG